MKTLTVREWKEKAVNLYGIKMRDWLFVCPQCKQAQSLNDFIVNNVPEPTTKFYYSCIGRWVQGRGCNWTLGGLFQFHETEVISEDGDKVPVFEFAGASNQYPVSSNQYQESSNQQPVSSIKNQVTSNKL